MENITIGRIVEFHPNGNEANALPNSMTSAPAIVTQVFGDTVNLCLFTANPVGEPTKQMWSVQHKNTLAVPLAPGYSYWDWFQKV